MNGLIKHHHTRPRSGSRGPQKKLKRVIKTALSTSRCSLLITIILSLTGMIECNLLLLKGVTLLVVLWCAGGFFVLAGVSALVKSECRLNNRKKHLILSSLLYNRASFCIGSKQ
jgi:uncharacterized membrane protein